MVVDVASVDVVMDLLVGEGADGEVLDEAQSLGGWTSCPFACPRIPWSSSCWS